MRKLDEQWIEEFDGQEHMLKAVEPFELCQGCLFNCNQGGCCWKGFDSCHMGHYFIIKDLGILNKDGCLPAAWDKALYPQVYRTTEAIWYAYAESYRIFMEATGKTKQEAIDSWNRRA